jgi:hypothetical protein
MKDLTEGIAVEMERRHCRNLDEVRREEVIAKEDEDGWMTQQPRLLWGGAQ